MGLIMSEGDNVDRVEIDQWGLDELVLTAPTMIHIERMSPSSVWVGIYKGNDRVSLFFNTRNSPVRVQDGDGDLEAFFNKLGSGRVIKRPGSR